MNNSVLIAIVVILVSVVIVGILLIIFITKSNYIHPQTKNLGSNLPSVGIMTMFKNEAINIYEWLLHYMDEGINRFVMVNNNSTDDYQSQLSLFLDKYPHVSIEIKDDPRKWSQEKIINDNIKNVNTDWVFHLDMDEFIYSRNGYQTIPEYFSSLDAKKISQVSVPWKMFGSSGCNNHPHSIIDSFVQRQDSNKKSPVKSAYPRRIVEKYSIRVHLSLSNVPGKKILSDGNKIKRRGYMQRNINKPCLHCNHYMIQSKEYFRRVKMTRGDSSKKNRENMRDWDNFKRNDFKDITDTELRDKRNSTGIWANRLPTNRPWP